MTIKHLVLGGGGPFGLVALGALKYLHDSHFWNIKDIKSIYATSIGAAISVYLTIGYDYDYIYNYFVKRPWEKIFNDIGIDNLIDFYNKRGLIDLYPLYYRSLNMLLEAKDLSPNITLKEYYDYCGIELYFLTTEVNNFSGVVLSHKTHPDLELIKSICMSGSFPGIFRPIVIDGKCYTDGGIFCNYPLKFCLDNTGCDINEVIGVHKLCDKEKSLINDESTVFEYLSVMMDNMVSYINDEKAIPYIPYDIECDMNIFNSYEAWINVPISQEHRAMLIDTGVEYAKSDYEKWLQKQQKMDDCSEGGDNTSRLTSETKDEHYHIDETNDDTNGDI